MDLTDQLRNRIKTNYADFLCGTGELGTNTIIEISERFAATKQAYEVCP